MAVLFTTSRRAQWQPTLHSLARTCLRFAASRLPQDPLDTGSGSSMSDELDHTTLRSVLDSVIGQRLEIAEADKLKAYPLEEGELDRAMERFSLRLGGSEGLEAFLKASDADASSLALVLSRIAGAAVQDGRILDT